MLRFSWPRNVVMIVLAAALGVTLPACDGDSKGEARRYQAAYDAFIASVRRDSAELANSVAAAYLDRTAADDPDRESNVIRQFLPQYQEFNAAYCRDLKAAGEAIAAGSESRAARRVSDARSMAGDLVNDAMASAILQGALAAPPERRDQLLAGLAVQAKAPDGTRLSGVAALQDAGLVGPDGRFAMPSPGGTAEYGRYETWKSHEAEGFGSRIFLLLEPTRGKLDECLPPR